MRTKIALTAFGASILFVGCSTWRCRGFIDVRDMPGASPAGSYKVERVEFEKPVCEQDQVNKLHSCYMWLKSQDGETAYTYDEEINRALGFTNLTADAISIKVTARSIPETLTGWSTIFWPLCGTLGVMPAHFIEDVPFAVDVRISGTNDLEREFVSMIRMDRQYGLSRYDMDSPPPAISAFGEARDDGTIGTGSEMRGERMRGVFIRTVSAVVLRAIADYENIKCERLRNPRTEFGPVDFPTYVRPSARKTDVIPLPPPPDDPPPPPDPTPPSPDPPKPDKPTESHETTPEFNFFS